MPSFIRNGPSEVPIGVHVEGDDDKVPIAIKVSHFLDDGELLTGRAVPRRRDDDHGDLALKLGKPNRLGISTNELEIWKRFPARGCAAWRVIPGPAAAEPQTPW